MHVDGAVLHTYFFNCRAGCTEYLTSRSEIQKEPGFLTRAPLCSNVLNGLNVLNDLNDFNSLCPRSHLTFQYF